MQSKRGREGQCMTKLGCDEVCGLEVREGRELGNHPCTLALWRGRKTVLRGPDIPLPSPGVISHLQGNGGEGLKALGYTFTFEPF